MICTGEKGLQSVDLDSLFDGHAVLEEPQPSVESPPLESPAAKTAPVNKSRVKGRGEWSPVYAKGAESARDVFIALDQNEYRYGAKGKGNNNDEYPCECEYISGVDDPETACGSESKCINRAIFVECSKNCPTGKHCRNKRFQKRQYALIEVFKTEKKGFGLEALEDLHPGDFVIEYVGEVLPKPAFEKRTLQYAEAGNRHFYFMSLKSDEVIDAQKKGNVARFMNHSCNPNCQLQKWMVGDQIRMGFFAIKHVRAGAELTFDYKFERYGLEAQRCYCGEPNCKGYIGAEKQEVDTALDRFYDASRVMETVTDIVKQLIQSPSDKETLRLFSKLQSYPTQEPLRCFIRCHGIMLLKTFLNQAKDARNPKLVQVLLELMLQLPIRYRISIDGDRLLNAVTSVNSMDWSDSPGIKTLVEEVLALWEGLPQGYKIKKSAKKLVAPTLDIGTPQSSNDTLDSSFGGGKRPKLTSDFGERSSSNGSASMQSPTAANFGKIIAAQAYPTNSRFAVSANGNREPFYALQSLPWGNANSSGMPPTVPIKPLDTLGPSRNGPDISSLINTSGSSDIGQIASTLKLGLPGSWDAGVTKGKRRSDEGSGASGILADSTAVAVQVASAIPGLDDSFIENVVNSSRKRSSNQQETVSELTIGDILNQFRKGKAKRKKAKSPVEEHRTEKVVDLAAYSGITGFSDFKQAVGKLVVGQLSMYKDSLEKPAFKFQARKLTHLLVHKDLKRGNSQQVLSGELQAAKKKKMKLFIEVYMQSFTAKKAE